jgi:hypothetical protein
MQLLQELKDVGFPVEDYQPKVICQVFEDNRGAMEWLKN